MGSEMNYLCPNCHHRVLLSPGRNLPLEQPPKSGEKLYCPSCEMLVVPEAHSAADTPKPRETTAGRTRAQGTNSGGSQSGDMSDQGSGQWRSDPAEEHPSIRNK